MRDAQLESSLKEINDLKAALGEHAIGAITDPLGEIAHVNDNFCIAPGEPPAMNIAPASRTGQPGAGNFNCPRHATERNRS